MTAQMTQYAPYPDELADAVSEFRYMEGWRFWLSDGPRDYADPARTQVLAGGLTFNIHVPCLDSYHPEDTTYPGVHHLHPVPAATFNRPSWERWIFDRLMDTVRHETAEWSRFEDLQGSRFEDLQGSIRRPWAATHGPGDDPYVLHEYATDKQRRTSFRGTFNE